jgi:hypothetical protein
MDGGGDDRRASGIIPDGGGALADRGIGVADGGGTDLRVVEGGARNGAADPPEAYGLKLGARLGGGTNARRAIVWKYYRKERSASAFPPSFLPGRKKQQKKARK